MPVKKCRMQAVAIGDEVFVGSGFTDDSQTDMMTVLKYNHIKDEWTRLPCTRPLCGIFWFVSVPGRAVLNRWSAQ